MKKCLTTLLIIAVAFTLSAQEKKTPAASPATQNHSHDGHNHDGHNHDGHSHGTPAAAPTAPGATTVKPATPANPNAARIVFKEETYDFTEIPEGPQATHEFKFTNNGKEPLVLSNVRASCGCTTPSWPKEPILPGKEGTIIVTYNTQGRPGPFTKSITINSNSDTPDKVIFIKGEVIKEDPTKSVPAASPNMMLAPKN